ncbi:adenomatous polyposis coli 2 [Cochliomyia hominivorax]
MFKIPEGEKNQSQATTPDLDDSISFSDDVNPDVDVDVDVDVDSVATKKRHFLDYDAVPPPDFVEHFDRAMNFGNTTAASTITATATTTTTANSQSNNVSNNGGSGEHLKLDKKYERDGEISDYELAASGYTKKEFTQDDNTLNITSALSANVVKPRKHFLDENPIPPDYMLNEHQMREHRSLDRNFERHNEQRTALDSHANLPGFRSSRERFKDIPAINRLPKGAAWTQSFDSRYESNLSADKLDDFGPKVECVYSLLSMLGSNDPLEMSKKFHELSKTPETCNTLRRSGCIPLLVQMIHAEGGPEEPRKWASMALHNVVHSHPDEKSGRREAKVLRLLDQIMDYCNFLRTLLQSGGEAIADDADRHPLAAMSSLMKVSFDEEHRHAMCELGALQAIPSLVHLDHAVHGPKPENQCCNSLRRFALMALTNLTFGDENNKALLCSQKLFMEALVAQLDSAPDDLLQVTASVLRNLSWRADAQMKAVLNEIGTVTALAKAAMKNKCENTLKAILSALWNLSAHCSTNKAEFCAVEGALSFIVRMLTYEGPSKTLKIIENAGGILRNVSSHIAVREDYRQILREHNCLSILLQQLKSESLTVVSNSCGTLWNLSARCPEDQRFLWDNGAVPMLRSLIQSKHAMISEGSACALKNLLNFRPSSRNTNHVDNIARSLNLKKLPTLNVRKQKALEQELGATSKSHSETCDNLDSINPKDRPTYDASAAMGSSIQRHRFPLHGVLGSVVVGGVTSGASGRLTRSAMLTKSESRDSVFSAKSDGAVYDHLMRSHSASDANRKINHNVRSQPPNSYPLEGDVEPAEEQPIDYSQKYKEHVLKHNDHQDDEENCPATYQETDLDQPTDFSLRYAENQLENDIDLSSPVGNEASGIVADGRVNLAVVNQQQSKPRSENPAEGNEILLILDDSVKCYQTEDTPYVISNAASVTDLRSVPTSTKVEENDLPSGLDNSEATSTTGPAQIPSRKFNRVNPHHQATQHSSNPYGSGSYTPEKPVNYCEEGTPGYFSRYESLSSLDESPAQGETSQKDVERVSGKTDENNLSSISKSRSGDADKSTSAPEAPPMAQTPQVNSALETPLMFSRRSSMDSLAEEDVGPIDDKSSIVSDFSRLASGVISPSEIPDSPTQSMPQSPRRNSGSGAASTTCFSAGISPSTQRVQNRTGENSKRSLRSVFEDDLNTFNVENTPAQFSTATSLSNLSILDEEPSNQSPPQQQQNSLPATTNTISEGEEEDANENNDDLLLASCINIGMNRAAIPSTYSQNTDSNSSVSHPTGMTHDEPRQYCTEDTPALLSKGGSNTNLSAISICSSANDPKENTVYEVLGCSSGSTTRTHHNQSTNRRSLNLSDDMSSNASESGAGGIDILQQCIRDGMQKPSTKEKVEIATKHPIATNVDPIAMLRRGGNILPPFVQVNDEMNKYRVEDSPCNFSVMSGLSNLTVGSSLVGPAVILQGGASNVTSNNTENPLPKQKNVASAAVRDDIPQLAAVPAVEDVRREPQWHDDSLSSLSIESEDDTNLLSQAIAAGCNRPKSNLGFTTALTSTGKHTTTSLSSSQPIPINTATSTSSLTSQATARNFEKQHNQHQQNLDKHSYRDPLQVGNESYSSVDSSDSNDNQSKSLFELCILTGMHKNRDSNMIGSSGGSTTSRKHTRSVQSHRLKSGHPEHNTTQSNPNLKQFDALPMQGKQFTPNRHVRERDRRDEKLLMECINTGIMKKIGESNKPSSLLTREALVLHNTQPKNGQATSAAAQMEEVTHPTSAKYTHNSSITTTNINTSINTATTITAAPDVEKKDNNFIVPETLNKQIHINNFTTNPGEDIKDQKSLNLFKQQNQVEEAQENPIPQIDVNHQNLENILETTKGIGSKYNMNNCDSLGNDGGNTTQSDESNQSFIMETTVSLETKQTEFSVSFNNCTEKHKDPDLMLKSVERLTLEFVSSAEQLRTNNSNATGNGTHSLSLDGSENQKKINSYLNGTCDGTNNSTSNNTWNEDTCPNDVSFPSVSVTAPKVASLSYDDDDEDQATTADYKELNDFAENTPINEELPAPDMSLDFDNIGLQQNGYYLDSSQPASLDCLTETENTLVNGDNRTDDIHTIKESIEEENSNGLHFKLGGIVQTAATAPSLFFNSNAMTNSTFIAQEARKLAATLHTSDLEEEEELTFSINSLDLDNIRPPSGMDSLNISGYYQDSTQPNSLHKMGNSPHSPQMSFKSPKFPRKNLPAGLVARRALGHMPPHLTGSVESINSSCNLLLDNIKPPSLMDELLDSMISVASIQSEIVDDCNSMATTVTVSNYETCAGGEDGDTVTLQSCCDNMLPKDDDQTLNEGNTTPLPSDFDFSSAESTPRKSAAASPATGYKRNLTPKQKRKIIKDRFKTYTIEADMIFNEELQRKMEEAQQDETLSIEITNLESDEKDQQQQPDTDVQSTPRSRRRSSQDRYKTQTIILSDLKFNQQTELSSLESNNEGLMDDNSYSSIKNMIQNFKFLTTPTTEIQQRMEQQQECELTSLEYDQNSETESCHNYGNNLNSLSDKEDNEDEQQGEKTQVTEIIRPRIVKPGENDSEVKKTKQDEESNDLNAVKSVRGGKKPQYVSPYSIKYQKSNVESKTNTKLQTPTANTNFLRKRSGNGNVAPTAATTGSSNTKIAQKKTITKEPIGKKLEIENNVAASAPTPQPAPLERQGTFVKDEPSLDSSSVPVVDTSPTKTKISKLPMKRQTSITTTTSAHTSPQKTASTRKLPTSSAIQAANKRNLGTVTKPQRANSTVNIRVTTNAARIAVLSNRVSTTTPPSRSNSSLNSTNAAVTAAQNAATKINQAQSRIAGIWRKVDEVKNRQQQQQSQHPSKILKGSQLKATKTAPQPGKLIRSTTFDSTPPLEVKPAKSVPQLNGTKLPTSGATKIAITHRQTANANRK